MAERTVFWRILTSFGKARKDADRLTHSMEDLQRQTKSLNDDTVAGNKEVVSSTRRRERTESSSIQSVISGLAKRASAERQAAVSTKARHRAEDSSIAASIAGLARLARARQQSVVSAEVLARSEQKVSAASLSRQRAVLALEAAQRRLSGVAKKAGQESEAYAGALLSVNRKTLEVEASTARHTRALADHNALLKRNSSSGGILGGTLGKLSGAFGKGGKAAKLFAAGLTVIKFEAIGTGIGMLLTGISQLTGGLLSLVGPLASVANAAAALPQAFAVAGGAVATFLGAFSGIGDALKAGSAVQKQAGDIAKAEKQSAEAVKQAQRGVRDAREAAADSARNNARAVQDASRAVVDAQKQEYEAAKALSEARKQAKRDIEDLKTSLRDLALDEEGASIAIEEARRNLQQTMMDPGADDLAKRSAQLAYDEALARMDDVRKAKKDADKEYAQAQKKGVSASDGVVAAQQAQIDSAKAVQRSQRDLADAIREQSRAARDSAEAISDAQKALADAKSTTAAGTTQVNAYNEALKNLSPAGRQFVKTLLGMRDEMKRLRFAAQEGLLPGGGKALTILLKLVPLAERGLRQFGQTMGETAVKGAKMLTSKEFLPMWNRLLESNNRLLKMGGDGFLNLLSAVVYLMDAARPFTEWLGKTVLGWTAYWKELAKAGDQTGSTAAKLERTKGVLKTLGKVIKNVWTVFKNFATAGRESGDSMLQGLVQITNKWVKWTGSLKGQNELKQWFKAGQDTMHETGALLGDIVRGLFDMGRKNKLAPLIKQIRTDLLPALFDIFNNLQGTAGTALVDGLSEIAKTVAVIVKGGSLAAFATTLGAIAKAFRKILEIPGMTTVFGIVAKAFGVWLALKWTRLLGPLQFLIGLLSKLVWWFGRLLIANPWLLLVAALAVAVYLIIKHWDTIKKAVSKAVKWVLDFLKKHWATILVILLGPLGLAIGLIIKHWDTIKRVFMRAVHGVVTAFSAAWGAIRDVFAAVGNWLGARAGDIWDVIHGAFTHGMNAVHGLFSNFIDGIQRIWDHLRHILGAPVEFAVNTIFREWLLGSINGVLGHIGLGGLKIPVPDEVHLARGGTVPGQGNRDSVPAVLMPGEFVMRRDAVKNIGVSQLHAMNEGRSYRGQKYARGGPVRKSTREGLFGWGGELIGKAKGVGKSVWNHTGGAAIDGAKWAAQETWGTVKNAAGVAVNLARLGAAKGLELMFKPFRGMMKHMIPEAGPVDDFIRGSTNKVMDAAVSWIRGVKEADPFAGAGAVPMSSAALPRQGQMNNPRFARGGKNKERTPALLTPGEFVLNRDAVARVGVGSLEKLNRNNIKVRKNVGGVRGHPSIPIQKFHSGGPVLGMRAGAKGLSVKALEAMAGVKMDGTWDPYLNSLLKSGKPVRSPAFRAKPSGRQQDNVMAWLRNADTRSVTRNKSYTVGSGERVGDVLKQFFGARYASHLRDFLAVNGFTKTISKQTTTNTGSKSLSRAISFAKAQNGKPYDWGGVGPGAYDCSGFQSAITNVLKGRSPYHRLFTTGSMGSALPGLGFKKGSGKDYTVGWYAGNPGHTSGRLGSLNVESTGNHVRVGSGARSPNSFPNIMHLDAPSGKKTTTVKEKTGTKTLASLLRAGSKVTVPKVPTSLGGRTLGQFQTRFHLPMMQAIGWINNMSARLGKVPADKKSQLMEGYRNQRKPLDTAMTALNTMLGLRSKGAAYTTDTQKALTHVLDHTYGVAHPLDMYRPWQSFSPVESALFQAQQDNAKEAQWQAAMTQLAEWGFTALTDHLFEQGWEDPAGFAVALDAAKKKDLASALNDQYAKSSALSNDDIANLIKLTAFINSLPNGAGLRDAARHLGLTDLQTVKLWEDGKKAGKFAFPAAKVNRMQDDVDRYRKGTFYAATGGQVPGTGSGDSVPAMLTPGEFVIRKESAKALGLQNLWALNNLQKFATGGLVLSPGISSIPTVATSGVSSRRMSRNSAGNVSYVYDVKINNPIAEKGTRSMLKMLQRQSALHDVAGAPK